MRRAASLLLLAGLVASTSAFAGNHFHGRGKSISLKPIGTYKTGVFDESAAEISAYDPRTKRLFVTNSDSKALDVLDIQDPTAPTKIFSIEFAAPAGAPTSVAVKHGLIAVAVPAANDTDAGTVRFYNANGSHKLTCNVGVLPDMVTFTPDGRYLLSANEGQPNDDYTIDPEGSVSIIDVKSVKYRNRCSVRMADFRKFNPYKAYLQKKGVRISAPGASVAQDIEPEYITVSSDSRTAWVSLQENNAFAVIDIRRAKVQKILPLGLKNHSLRGNKLDASDKDDSINITNWPVYGMYQPDSIASYKYGRKTFIVSANEGDSRDYDGFSEEVRVKDLDLDPVAYPDADELQKKGNIGRLKTTTASGDTDGDGDIDKIHIYGARSFSIWSSNGRLVFDSGDDFEKITANKLPNDFNSNNDENDTFDARSDDKGPEPEGVSLATIHGQTYAFIGLERVGGIMIYNITNPYRPHFVDYVTTRDFAGDAEAGTAGDLAPEGMLFISAKDSPNRKPLLVVTNEVSGSTTIFEIKSARRFARH